MEWSDKQDLVLFREVLVIEPYQHPYRSKEMGDVWKVFVEYSDDSKYHNFTHQTFLHLLD